MSDSAASAPAPALPSGSHPLESSWTIWFDKKVRSHILRFVCIGLCMSLCRHGCLFFRCFRCLPQKWRRALATPRTYASWQRSGHWKNFGVFTRIYCVQTSCQKIPIIMCSERVSLPILCAFLFLALTLFYLSGYLPMWESFPFGGCWIIRVRLPPPSIVFIAFFCFAIVGD